MRAPDGAPSALDSTLRRLAISWRGYWPGSDTDAIADDLRDRFADATATWGLSEARPLPGGFVALVCSVLQDGRLHILKLSPRGHPDTAQLATEGDALSFWGATGVVPRLLGRRDDGLTVLMERIDPGWTLEGAELPWDEKVLVVGRLVRRLHAAGRPGTAFIDARGYTRGWRERLASEPDLLALLDDLTEPRDDDILIHADLHPGNVLRSGDSWKVIDPHGVFGERHADIWGLLDPLVPGLPDDPAAASLSAWQRLRSYAEAAGLDPERAGAWVRLRGLTEARDIESDAQAEPEERAWAVRLHRMADALA
jgi:streptomycin 6-kinase